MPPPCANIGSTETISVLGDHSTHSRLEAFVPAISTFEVWLSWLGDLSKRTNLPPIGPCAFQLFVGARNGTNKELSGNKYEILAIEEGNGQLRIIALLLLIRYVTGLFPIGVYSV